MISRIMRGIEYRFAEEGLVSTTMDRILAGEVLQTEAGADRIKDSLKSLTAPFGLPLVGVGCVYFGSRWVVGRIASNVEGWRWYFRWPVKLILGLGGFIIFLGSLELLSDNEYSDNKHRNDAKERSMDYKKEKLRRLHPEPSNTVESDGAGGLRRRIDDFKYDGMDGFSRAIFKTGREEKSTLDWPFIKYNRRKPHWQKNTVRKWRSSPFIQIKDLS